MVSLDPRRSSLGSGAPCNDGQVEDAGGSELLNDDMAKAARALIAARRGLWSVPGLEWRSSS